jgi:hypothetical protein
MFPNIQIRTIRPAPVEIVLAKRVKEALSERDCPIIPEPTTIIKRKVVPMYSLK